jgi:hypothetical protein
MIDTICQVKMKNIGSPIYIKYFRKEFQIFNTGILSNDILKKYTVCITDRRVLIDVKAQKLSGRLDE